MENYMNLPGPRSSTPVQLVPEPELHAEDLASFEDLILEFNVSEGALPGSVQTGNEDVLSEDEISEGEESYDESLSAVSFGDGPFGRMESCREKDEMHFESLGPYCPPVTDSMEERMLDMQAYIFRCQQPESFICVVDDAGKVETVVDVGFDPDTAVVELPATSTEERLVAPNGRYGSVVVTATFLIASTLTVSCWLLSQLYETW